jgi:hypothetical protein
LEKMAADTGAILPALESRVRPYPHLTFYWNAFFNLSSDRQVGLSLGRIPWTSIDRYAARYRVDNPDSFDLLVRFLRAMDEVLLAYEAARADGARAN